MTGRHIIEGISGNRPNGIHVHQHIKNFIVFIRDYTEELVATGGNIGTSCGRNIIPEP
ncbi:MULTISPECIES: hypothetical protein [Methanosarcina]|uniref:hypothetical protein n=1 Tax=Methanosarcina TaxID=2207 RepID=UPI0012D3F53E|nr:MULTISPECIES: hypothetical protein [Methanosarcina]